MGIPFAVDWDGDGRTTSPTACDFNADGIPDIVLGAEDGFFYYLKNPRR